MTGVHRRIPMRVVVPACLSAVLAVLALAGSPAAYAAGAPAAPRSLVVTAITASEVTLSWQAPDGGTPPASYQVLRALGRHAYHVVATVTGTAFTDTGRSPSTTYNYEVRAVDPVGGVSTLSNQATAITHRAGTTVPAGVACLVEYYP